MCYSFPCFKWFQLLQYWVQRVMERRGERGSVSWCGTKGLLGQSWCVHWCPTLPVSIDSSLTLSSKVVRCSSQLTPFQVLVEIKHRAQRCYPGPRKEMCTSMWVSWWPGMNQNCLSPCLAVWLTKSPWCQMNCYSLVVSHWKHIQHWVIFILQFLSCLGLWYDYEAKALNSMPENLLWWFWGTFNMFFGCNS